MCKNWSVIDGTELLSAGILAQAATQSHLKVKVSQTGKKM
jgi:hypothetical protein